MAEQGVTMSGSSMRNLVVAAVSHPWFRVMLFLVAVPAPTPCYASGVVMAWAALFLALLVLGFLGYKAFVWRKSPREGGAADNPWLIMVLLLLAGPGIMECALILLLYYFLLLPAVYLLPLFLVLGFLVFRGLRQGETQQAEPWRLANPWCRVLLIVVGLPFATVYFFGIALGLLFIFPLLLFHIALLWLFARIERVNGSRQARDRRTGEGRRPSPWFSLVRRIAVFVPMPLASYLLQSWYIDRIEAVPGHLSLLLEWLPMIVILGFCVCRAMVWKPPREDDA